MCWRSRSTRTTTTQDGVGACWHSVGQPCATTEPDGLPRHDEPANERDRYVDLACEMVTGRRLEPAHLASIAPRLLS